MDKPEMKGHALAALRWFASVAFFFFAGVKIKMILSHGLEPYRIFSETVGWPASFQYYGVVAVLLEITTAILLWNKALFRLGILLMIVLTFTGFGISIYSLIFKISANCGCGLFGDNEYWLIAQKLLILIALFVLFLNKKQLFRQNN